MGGIEMAYRRERKGVSHKDFQRKDVPSVRLEMTVKNALNRIANPQQPIKHWNKEMGEEALKEIFPDKSDSHEHP